MGTTMRPMNLTMSVSVRVATMAALTAMIFMAATRSMTTRAIADEPWPAMATPVGHPQRVEVHPASIRLSGPRERVQFVVTGIDDHGEVRDLTHAAEYEADDPGVLALEGSVARPTGDGVAVVSVRAGDVEASATVEVSGYDRPRAVSFEYDALAALSKQGCNSGACHGSPSGKGGFRLSLRAFDPAFDRSTLVREHVGRRVNPIEPEESLLLAKPMMKVWHGGGKQIRPQDPAYRVLVDWIAAGCPTEGDEEARCVGLQVHPPAGRVLKWPAHTQQFSALAHFSDGSVRDVSEMAVYSSSDVDVASVTETGLVTGKQRGQAAVIVRYMEFVETSLVTFVEDVEGYAWEGQPTHNDIDALVDAQLRQLRYVPSDVCRDDEFVRRIFLDILGRLPQVSEVETFLADASPDKRSRLIDDLLERPEFAKFWALKWGDLMRLTRDQVGDDGVYKFHRWLERAVADNMPYDEFARQLLTAQGSTHVYPPANFYRTATDANDCVETVSQVFLGARLQCAKCHNHPAERWTQDDYYGMAAFFNRVQRKNTLKPDETLIWVSKSGEVTQPRTGEQMKPSFPAGQSVDATGVDDRRELFARWLVSPDNPFFAKIEVNRIWSYLLGRGIVDPPDDFRDSNPPSNAALLEMLAKEFVDSGFDRKRMIRTITNSRTYQASARPNESNRDEERYFSRRYPRFLTAEQLLDAIADVTGVPEAFSGLPEGTRATHLPAPDVVKHPFLEDFGQPHRKTVCQCERASESNLDMAMQFYNGPLIDGKLKHANNRFRQRMKAGASDEAIITELYLAAYSRPPSDHERTLHLEYLADRRARWQERLGEAGADAADGANPGEGANPADGADPGEGAGPGHEANWETERGQAFEDVTWALLTSNEFLLQR